MQRQARFVLIVCVTLVLALSLTNSIQAGQSLTSQQLSKLDPVLQLAIEASAQGYLPRAELTGVQTLGSPVTRHLLSESLARTIDLHMGGDVPTVNVLIKTRDSSALKLRGVKLQAVIGDIVTANVPVHRLTDLARLPSVVYIEASRPEKFLNDAGRVDAGAAQAHEAFGLTGDGVIVGIVDSGIDWTHEDFRNPDGATRIKYLLDFSDPGGPDSDGELNGDPRYYGGTLYTEDDINAALVDNGVAYESTDTPVAIPDDSSVTSEIDVGASVVIDGLAVRVDVSHSWIGDLTLTLRSPEGTEVVLHDQTGGWANDIQGYFSPDGFDGENAAGTWSLYIGDSAAGESGGLRSWSLHINQRVRQADRRGHGTHVAGSAAGNGLGTGRGYPAGTYAGMAPGATLIVVKASRTEGAPNTGDAINAFSFIDQMAAELGMPYVINYSAGRHFGAHDGTALDEQAIDALVGSGQPGQAIVVAAGNEGDQDIHAGGNVSPGGQGQLSFEIADARSAVVFNAWYDGSAAFDVGLDYPGGADVECVTRPISGGDWEPNCDRMHLEPGDETRQFAIYRTSDERVLNGGSVQSSDDNPNNGDKQIVFRLFGETEVLQQGTWHVILYNDSPTNARYYAWMTTGPGFSNADDRMRVGMPGTARNAIAVGAHTTKTRWTDIHGGTRTIAELFGDRTTVVGNRAPFSSDGPTRDGRLKPELTAPGYVIASTYSRGAQVGTTYSGFIDELVVEDGRHIVLKGTSMAAPHVTGAVALLLEAAPSLDAAEIRDLLTSTARGDSFTGARPNQEWGYGKLDVFAAVQRLQQVRPTAPAVYLPLVLRNPTEVAPVPTPTPTATVPPAGGIHGQVRFSGAGVSGVTMILRHCTPDGCSSMQTTTTDSTGNFNFTGVPSLAADESYYVLFLNGPGGGNSDDPNRLAWWRSFNISSYTAGSRLDVGGFDIANVALLSPPHESSEQLPVTFTWAGRGVAGDRYAWAIADQDGTELCYQDPPRADTSFVLDAGTAADPCGLSYNTPYRWYVYLINENGYGLSYYYWIITLIPPSTPPTATPTPTPTGFVNPAGAE